MVEDPKLHRHSVWLNECKCKVTSIKRLQTRRPARHCCCATASARCSSPTSWTKKDSSRCLDSREPEIHVQESPRSQAICSLIHPFPILP